MTFKHTHTIQGIDGGGPVCYIICLHNNREYALYTAVDSCGTTPFFFPFYLKKKNEIKWVGGYALSSQTLITSNRWQ